MTKIKLTDETIINASEIELINGILKITTTELTVEELATLFSNKSNTSIITLLTENDVESGFKTGFTSFAGISYGVDGSKTIELFQPKDTTENRISNAEGVANMANENAFIAIEQNGILLETVDVILTEIIPSIMM